MDFTKTQLHLLMEVSKQTGGKSMNEVGKRVYKTYVSIHNNMKILHGEGLIILERNKNKIVPKITSLGRKKLMESY